MDRDDKIYEIEDELFTYIEYDGTEIGELCERLLSLLHLRDYCLRDSFVEELEKEILEQYENFKNHATLTEKEETHTIKVISLEWEY
jgi:hypothetical protein